MPVNDIIKIITTVGIVQGSIDLFFNYYIFSQPSYTKLIIKLSLLSTKYQLAIDKEQEQQQQQQQQQIQVTVTSTKNNTTNTSNTKNKNSSSSKKKNTNANTSISKKQSIENDYKDSIATIARQHIVPNIITSIIFIIIMKILGTEYSSKIIAVLPFTPFTLLRYITSRGLQFTNLNHVKELSSLLLVESTTGSTSSIVTNASQACSFMFIYMLSTMSIKFYINKLLATTPPINRISPNDAIGLMSLVDSPSGQRFLNSIGLDPTEYLQTVKQQ